jgi:hypothetical protein
MKAGHLKHPLLIIILLPDRLLIESQQASSQEHLLPYKKNAITLSTVVQLKRESVPSEE